MLEKEKHIEYWVVSADESWKSAETLISGGRYMMALFCWNLCIEKLLKANWIKFNEENFPPRTHNLLLLHDQANLNLNESMQADLKIIMLWNIEGRYPDYRNLIYKAASKEYLENNRILVEKIRTCLIEKLQ